MSTIQLILESLEKTKSDKTDRLDVLYREHSMWLQDQLNKIQDLIQPNSAVMAAVKEIEEKKLIAAPDMPISKKRKSPETAYQGPKQSPEQKRASLNFEELFVSIGLPSDPNRATKDVLLSALATLGLINVPAKTLKKDLIEMIKDQLSAQRRVSEQSSQNNVNTEEAPEEIEEVAQNDFVEVELEENTPATEQVEDTSSIEVEEAIPSEPEQVAPTYQSSPSKTPGRKGSLMLSTFRDMINNQVPAPAEPEKEKEARASIIESEFKNRYRASQIRKSQILENPEETISSQTTMESEFTQEEVEAEVVEENTVEEEEQAEEQVEEEPEEEVIEADGVEVAAEEEVVAEIEEEAEKEDEGTWMEVASPIKCAEPVHVEVTAPESLEGTGSSFSSTSESAKSDSSKSSLSSQSSAVAKKPGNLQSGQTSFLDKGPSKPVVVSLH